jgi:Spy/CpxP family protein refolding chaperone
MGVTVGAWLVFAAVGASMAQEAAPPAGPRGQARRAGEVARLFDAYALMQAQETLGLDDAQYAKFVGRFRALSDARRQHQQTRVRIVQDLARLTRGDGPFNEQELRERMKALDDADAQARVEVAAALQAVDELLTVPQRARFRVLEEQLERRKWELMARARQGGRPGQRDVQGQEPGRRVEPR